MVACGHLKIALPWASSSKGVVEIAAQDIQVVVRRCDYLHEITAERLRDIKEERVRNRMAAILQQVFEGAGAARPASQANTPSAAAAAKAGKDKARGRVLLRKLLGRIQPKVNISNLHLRYEELTDSRAPCAMGCAWWNASKTYFQSACPPASLLALHRPAIDSRLYAGRSGRERRGVEAGCWVSQAERHW